MNAWKIPFSLTAMLLAGPLTAQPDDIILIDSSFDSGRVQMNATLTKERLGQWANTATGAGNVGWNEQGIWYSFTRFGATDTEGLPVDEIFAKIDAAERIELVTDVYWYEIASGFPGDPGVVVSVYFVPQLVVPEGSLPTTQNTWPFIYPNRVKVATIPPSTEPLRQSNRGQDGPGPYDPATDVLDVRIDLTDAIKEAIAAGHLDASTPWGIVYFPEDMEDELDVPNNPKWIDKRQTVMLSGYDRLELFDEPAGEEWYGYAVDANGWANTGDWMGWVNVWDDPYIFMLSLDNYAFIDDDSGWVYVYRP